jgi:AraC family L-rhamnose operon transcriptional activator RhaR/AraC family L-rhamnose operon regulatory protein RhaS
MSDIYKYASGPEDVIIKKGVMTRESFPLHCHDFCEIAIIQSGRGVYTDNYGERPLLPGDVFILRKPEFHGFSKLERMHIVNICFVPERLSLPYDELRKISGYNVLFEIEPLFRGGLSRASLNLSPEELHKLNDYVKIIEQEQEQQKPGYRIKLKSLLLDVIILLSRIYSSETDSKGTYCSHLLGETIAYIKIHYREKHTLDSLSRRAGMSKPHFIRMFKKITGLPPVDYINQTRIDQACKLLGRDEYSIARVATESGFPDSNYFSRTFKKHLGMSPRQYVNSYLKPG